MDGINQQNHNYRFWIGKKVKKSSGRIFKSSLKVNTVRDIGIHLILSQKKGRPIPCFVFEEDDSYVGCSACELVDI